MDEPKIIDIGMNNLNDSYISLNIEPTNDSGLGPGIEMLMNDKTKKQQSNSSFNDINSLENELNELTNTATDTPVVTLKEPLTTSMFSNIKINEEPLKNVYGNNSNNPTINLGNKTAQQTNNSDFNKFNEIPVNPSLNMSSHPSMSKEELLKEKFSYLRKLESLERKGVNLTKKYSMESNLSEMKGEYEMIISEKEKSNSVKFQAKMLMACVTGIEFLNNRFDPFDVKLDGWGESVNENINDYDEVFSELHEKYKSKAQMAPEIKLLFMLGGSAIMTHMTNAMFKSAMPGMDDIMRQNPELMQQFTQAAANSMQQESNGFSNFMSSFAPGGNPHQDIPQRAGNNPQKSPFPFQQQQQRTSRQTAPANRPDIQRSRKNSGIQINQFGTETNSREVEKTPRQRPEMKGPANIDDILSNLKTKKININRQEQEDDVKSIISVEDYNNIAKSSKKPKRKPISERNTISLDI
tara:strand:+ start:285 stop:1685 length:1401 start_codon:yes stop_codon:yes gene_type:complete